MGEVANKQASLKANTLIYGIGNLSIFAIKFFLVPLYTFYLSESALGWFDVMAATVPMVAVVLGGHIELALLRWMLEKPARLIQNQVFTNSFVLNAFGIGIFTLIYGVLTYFNLLNVDNYTTPLLLYFYIVSVWVYTFIKQSIRSIFSAKMFVATDIVFTLLFLTQVIVYVVILDLKIEGILLAYSLSNLLICLFWMFYKRMYQYLVFETLSMDLVKELLRYSLPLVPNTLNLWSINTIVKYVILFFLGIVSNGIFAIAFKIGFIIQMINGIFNKAWQDKAISSYTSVDFKAEINPIFQKYFVIFSCMTLGLIAGQWIVVEHLIDSNFHEATNYIWFIALGFFFTGLANFISVIYQGEKQTMAITVSSIFANVILVSFALLLTNRYALYGASIAFLLGNFSLFLYRFYHIQRFVKLSLDLKYVLLFLGALVSVLYLTLYSSYLAVLLASAFALVFNYKEINKLIASARKRLKRD